MKNVLKKIPKYYYILLLVSFIVMLPSLINGGIFGDDYPFHLGNIMGMDINSTFLKLPTRIRAFVGIDMGYGTGIFYPQLFHLFILYIYKIIKIVHLPLSVAIIIGLFIITFFAALAMRKLLYLCTEKNNVSTLGAILYVTFPYYLCDIYTRSAYGEIITFIALPLIFIGLHYLLEKSDKTKFYLFFVLGYFLVINSHLISTLYITIFALIYLVFNIKKVLRKDKFVSLLIASFFIILFSLNIVIPILEHQHFADYMVFVPGHMYSIDKILDYILPLKELFIPGDWKPFFIPISSIILLFIFIINYKKIVNEKNKSFIYSLFIILFISILLIVCFRIWTFLPDILLMIQFPWRLLTYVSFSLSILCTYAIKIVNSKKINAFVMFLAFLTFIFIIVNPYYVIKQSPIRSYRTSGMGWNFEYLTLNSYNKYDDLEKLEKRSEEGIITSKDTTINLISNDVPNMKFEILVDEPVTVELPRFYYLWYKIKNVITNENIEFYESENGLIEFKLDSSATIEVKYEKTNLSKSASIISLTSVLGFIGFEIYNLKKEKITRN